MVCLVISSVVTTETLFFLFTFISSLKKSCLELALKAVRVVNCCLVVSIPCTGGSQMFRTNCHRAGYHKRLHDHRKVFCALMKNLVTVTREARKYGARIILEWPRNCSYWQEPIVQRYMYENQLKPVQVDGCSEDSDHSPTACPSTSLGR